MYMFGVTTISCKTVKKVNVDDDDDDEEEEEEEEEGEGEEEGEEKHAKKHFAG